MLKNKFIPTSGLQINMIQDEENTTMYLKGRLSIDYSPELRDRLLSILHSRPPKTVTIDLSEVPYVDTSGIATLIEALKTARTCNTTLLVKGLQDRLLHVLEVTGVAPLFRVSSHPGAAPTSRVS